MSSDLAISARGVTKRYRIRTDATGESAVRARRGREWFTALDNVDLDVPRGEVLGLVGRNGSGKSTLLKVFCRVTAPSEGVVDVWGRVGSLLEVGTGFHAELTGRENVYLNGAILGMKQREITRQFDDIVEFADIGPFLDTPVKRYSSGMRVRLAFAVAAHLDPEILLVDEVLAVGDADFQSKCLGKMSDVAENEGRTVVFVSHNLAAIEHLCSRVAVLGHGRVEFVGAAEEAIGHYLSRAAFSWSHDDPGVYVIGGTYLSRVITTDGDQPVDQLFTGQPLVLWIDLDKVDHIVAPNIEVLFSTSNEQVVFKATTRMGAVSWANHKNQARVRLELRLEDLPLLPGNYLVGVNVWDHADTESSLRESVAQAAELHVAGSTNVYGTGYQPRAVDGLVYVRHNWTVGTRADT
jgi:lipopolysaccharide transport system ATP-binding protein